MQETKLFTTEERSMLFQLFGQVKTCPFEPNAVKAAKLFESIVAKIEAFTEKEPLASAARSHNGMPIAKQSPVKTVLLAAK